tara:strand:- start:326 stop:1234 length:909 start_codon:yes stop_codon:yes gene_type:complete
MSKLIVVLGPTATGKTKLAVKIANKYRGEIISADSRQIYKGMDIGTGKDLNEYQINHHCISHHLIDILDPQINYSVFQFKQDFIKVYNSLLEKKKLPILCGGTGLYIESVLLNYQIPNVGPNDNLREMLNEKSLEDLSKYLKAISIDQYDEKYHITKRRIIRTIEIIKSKKTSHYSQAINIKNPLIIGIDFERGQLLNNIKKRLEERLEAGMIEEVQALINNGMELDRLKYFGLEYKFIGQYLFNEVSYQDMLEKLNYAINRFSKRQMTFFRRMERRGLSITWIPGNDLDLINKNLQQYLSM